ncbi:tryptophan synthase subunit alpha [Helicobacter sp. 12S02634-8]|uniref:tryptophan synthase subunit alpha n=1 Tax=Helicobacter sp. 12S02634-8 TaxID=1476199 RepID=UPI000BA70C23|nr:tryptophan synthase subunit alpha [Helicobacter sp. 12S02634-8]PAF48046.1 tryptophan synthase subunit alpha [Helicobacter sp. 12S02634-8]
MKKIPLMGHIIAGYPSKISSIEAGLGICDGGASFLEVQFPFSDPNADGPIIENACNIALQNGFIPTDGFEITATLAAKTDTKIIIVTYANIIFTYGVEKFIQKAKACGVYGLIVPDLPFESDEGLRAFAKSYGLYIIELITPHMQAERIKKLSSTPSDLLYVVARSGTTGSETQIQAPLFEWIDFVRHHTQKKLALGFGIRSHAQIQALKDKADILVIGSYFVETITATPPHTSLRQSLKNCVLELFA